MVAVAVAVAVVVVVVAESHAILSDPPFDHDNISINISILSTSVILSRFKAKMIRSWKVRESVLQM